MVFSVGGHAKNCIILQLLKAIKLCLVCKRLLKCSKKCEIVLKFGEVTQKCAAKHAIGGYFLPHSVDCRAAGFTYISSVNGCYKLVNRNLEWSVAGLECRSLHKDAHLLVINDEQEQTAVAGMLASISRQ